MGFGRSWPGGDGLGSELVVCLNTLISILASWGVGRLRTKFLIRGGCDGSRCGGGVISGWG